MAGSQSITVGLALYTRGIPPLSLSLSSCRIRQCSLHASPPRAATAFETLYKVTKLARWRARSGILVSALNSHFPAASRDPKRSQTSATGGFCHGYYRRPIDRRSGEVITRSDLKDAARTAARFIPEDVTLQDAHFRDIVELTYRQIQSN